MRWRGRPRDSLAGGRYQLDHGPAILTTLTESWGLPDHERAALWRALCQAQWSESAALREQLIAFAPTTDDVTRTFLETACHPGRFIAVCEALVAEGYLTRATASRIQSRILDTPGWGSGWQWWTPAQDALQGDGLCRVITEYWR
jgi:hypothetical protein